MGNPPSPFLDTGNKQVMGNIQAILLGFAGKNVDMKELAVWEPYVSEL